MHHSRVSSIMIDCLDEHFEDSLAFWSRALGLPVHRQPENGDRYVALGEIQGPIAICLQRVSDHPGFHLDIESDEGEAEKKRLEAAGARTKYRVKQWWVLEDPSGNPFCIVRPESDQFPKGAQQWDGE